MIGVDTNVLVRAVFEDHPKESPLAQQFLKQTAKDKKLFVSSYAVLEMVWVLKVKQRSRQEIYEAVLDLLDSPGIMVGQREVVMSALEKYIKGKADFGDYLILSEGEHYQVPRLVSFDKVFKGIYTPLGPYGFARFRFPLATAHAQPVGSFHFSTARWLHTAPACGGGRWGATRHCATGSGYGCACCFGSKPNSFLSLSASRCLSSNWVSRPSGISSSFTILSITPPISTLRRVSSLRACVCSLTLSA